MADTKRYYELDPWLDVDVRSTDVLPIDADDFTQVKKITVEHLLSPEATLRDLMDNAIITGCGLESDGSFAADDTTNYLTVQDFVDYGLDESIKNALFILDAELKNTSNNLNCSEYILSASELTTMNATPVTVIVAPGAGIYNHLLHLSGWLTFVTTPYTSIADIKFRYVGGTDVIATIDNDYITSGSTIYFKATVNSDVEILLNTAIEAYVDDALTLGDGIITLKICYNGVDTNMAGSGSSTTCCVDSYTTTFVDADLTGGWIEWNHALNSIAVIVAFIGKDDAGEDIFISAPTYPGRQSTGFSNKTTYVSAYFDSIGAGTYRVIIMAKV